MCSPLAACRPPSPRATPAPDRRTARCPTTGSAPAGHPRSVRRPRRRRRPLRASCRRPGQCDLAVDGIALETAGDVAAPLLVARAALLDDPLGLHPVRGGVVPLLTLVVEAGELRVDVDAEL